MVLARFRWFQVVLDRFRLFELIPEFSKYLRSNKPLKFAVLAWFSDFSAEIRINQRLHITFRPCYKTKSFAKKKKHFLKKIYKVDIVNKLFLASWSNTKLLRAFSDNLAFCRDGLSVFTKLNLMFLTSVNNINRGK